MARTKKGEQVVVEQELVQEAVVAGTRARTDTNLVVLTGRLGTDPELRYIGERGTPVAEFRLASSYAIGAGDEAREETTWATVKCWNRLAEIVGEYLRSGRRVLVTGRLKEERWQDRETGQNRSRLVVTAERIEFLDGPRGVGMLDEEVLSPDSAAVAA